MVRRNAGDDRILRTRGDDAEMASSQSGRCGAFKTDALGGRMLVLAPEQMFRGVPNTQRPRCRNLGME
jgi:hypothetical protein